MDADVHIDHLDREGTRLIDAAERRGWDAPVAGLAWDVRALVLHIGGVHRWATTIVSGGSADDVGAAAARMGEPVPDDELAAWFRAGHAANVAALRAAPADLEAFTFLRGVTPRDFWARRQAHETAIHRADAEGPGATYDRDFATDGIAEILAFGQQRGFTIDRAATLALRPDDGPARRLRFGGERTVIEDDDGTADASVEGSSSELYLWLWNRPSGVRIEGDPEVAALWASKVRIGWN